MTDPTLADLIRQHATLYASFDDGINADHSRGDPAARINDSVARHEPSGGRYGGCLAFEARDHAWAEDEFTFAAADNFPYGSSSFAGTISLWLCGDPDADLHPDYPVDPFHISRHAADGSFYLDLTRPNDDRYGSPRKLRFGLYGDSPVQDKFVGGQLIVVGELGWHDRRWHHLVATFSGANSGASDAAAALYIDGRLRGWITGYRHALTWNVPELRIGLGQRYVGRIDELLILDRALTAEQVAALYALPSPAGSCWA